MNILKKITQNSRNIRWSKDIFTYSGAIAFYMIFSFPAIILIILVLTRRIIQDDIILSQIQNYLDFFVSSTTANNLVGIVQNYVMHQSTNVQIALAVILTVYIAAFSIITIERGLNHIRNNNNKSIQGGIITYLKSHMKALLLIGFVALLLVGLVFANFFIEIIHANTDALIVSATIQRRNDVMILGGIFIICYFCYKYLIKAQIPREIMYLGSGLFTIIFLPMKETIRLYLGRGSTSTIYAATSSIIILMLRIYFVMLVFFTTTCITKGIHLTLKEQKNN